MYSNVRGVRGRFKTEMPKYCPSAAIWVTETRARGTRSLLNVIHVLRCSRSRLTQIILKDWLLLFCWEGWGASCWTSGFLWRWKKSAVGIKSVWRLAWRGCVSWSYWSSGRRVWSSAPCPSGTPCRDAPLGVMWVRPAAAESRSSSL